MFKISFWFKILPIEIHLHSIVSVTFKKYLSATGNTLCNGITNFPSSFLQTVMYLGLCKSKDIVQDFCLFFLEPSQSNSLLAICHPSFTEVLLQSQQFFFFILEASLKMWMSLCRSVKQGRYMCNPSCVAFFGEGS